MLDDFSQIVHDMPPADREAYFALPADVRRDHRLAWLGQRSLARATASPHPDPALSTLARRTSAQVVSRPEPDTVPVARNLTSELRDSEAHDASQSRPSQSRSAERPSLTLRRPPAPTGTRAERHSQLSASPDTVPVTRDLTHELQGGAK